MGINGKKDLGVFSKEQIKGKKLQLFKCGFNRQWKNVIKITFLLEKHATFFLRISEIFDNIKYIEITGTSKS